MPGILVISGVKAEMGLVVIPQAEGLEIEDAGDPPITFQSAENRHGNTYPHYTMIFFIQLPGSSGPFYLLVFFAILPDTRNGETWNRSNGMVPAVPKKSITFKQRDLPVMREQERSL